jgi:hypothetical protein
MVTCCGQDRASRFCPECGKKLQDHPLDSLLSHAREVLKVQETRAANLRKKIAWQAENPDARRYRPDVCEEDLIAPERLAAKWRAWAEALEAVLDVTPAPPP